MRITGPGFPVDIRSLRCIRLVGDYFHREHEKPNEINSVDLTRADINTRAWIDGGKTRLYDLSRGHLAEKRLFWTTERKLTRTNQGREDHFFTRDLPVLHK